MNLKALAILSLLSVPATAQPLRFIPLPAPAPLIYSQPYLAPHPPITYQTYGGITYGSDGSTAQRYGNQTYIFPGNSSQPSVICSTYANITTCQ